MSKRPVSSRRTFLTDAVLGAATASAALSPSVANAASALEASAGAPTKWDLSWTKRLNGATDRALFDWPSLGDPADPTILSFADRYVQNCAAAYGSTSYRAVVVFNIRTQAIPAAFRDELWERYALGVEYKTNDPATSKPATRNPFWRGATGATLNYGIMSLEQFVAGGAQILVCDFAMGHLATRLAAKSQRSAAEIHEDLLRGLVPNAFAVPSGVFGMAKAQNAGCAFVKML